jgi:hypothetical protein
VIRSCCLCAGEVLAWPRCTARGPCSDREVTHHTCPGCSREYDRVIGFLLRDGDARAIYREALHGHDDELESWIDFTFDGIWSEPVQTIRISLGCRVGLFAVASESAAALVSVGLAYPEGGMFGARLTRDQALVHPLLPE